MKGVLTILPGKFEESCLISVVQDFKSFGIFVGSTRLEPARVGALNVTLGGSQRIEFESFPGHLSFLMEVE